jgi:diguanylate cyclase (GGDEF)-like protein
MTWETEAKPILQRRHAGHVITIRKRIEAAEREQRNLAEALRATAGLLTSTLRLDEVLERILENIERVVNHKIANIMLVENGVARIVRCRGYPSAEIEKTMLAIRFPIAEVVNFRRMSETGRALAVPDTGQSPDWIETPAAGWQRSYAGAPIRVKGQTIGFLNLDSDIPGCFSQDHADRLQAFADQAAIAIENARLFEETRQRGERLALINDISATINQPVELGDVWQTAVDTLASALGIHQTSLALFDESRQRLTVVAERPAPGNGSGLGLEIPLDGNGSMDQILAKKSWFASQDAQNDPLLEPAHAILTRRSVRSILLVPLLVGDEVIGTLGCDSIEAQREFNAGEISLAVTIANLVAIKIEQARLLEVERRTRQEAERQAEELRLQARRMELLNEITLCSLSRSLSRSLSQPNLPEMLDAIANRLCCLVQADGAYISLWDGSAGAPVPAAGCGMKKNEFLSLQFRPGDCSLTGEALRLGRSIVFEDVSSCAHAAQHAAASILGRSILAVPLIADGKKLGAALINFKELHPFTPDEMALCEQAAGQIALAIAKVKLFEETQRLAITDELTGIYNRRGLYELGRREVERALRFHRPLSAIMLDIDHFKRFNDVYGHAIGDQVLHNLAQRIQNTVRDIDIVGRYGGEEFVVLLPENELSTAGLVAERLHSRIVEQPIPTRAGALSITVSIGVASAALGVRDLDTLIKHADVALYRAKETGRNRVSVG